MNKAFLLPEKDFFTIEEIAERWRCSTSDVEHHIYHSRKLKPSIISGYVSCVHHVYGRKWGSLKTIDPELEVDDFVGLPRLLYVDPDNFVYGPSDPIETKIETRWFHDFDGNLFALCEVNGLLVVDGKIEFDALDGDIRTRFTSIPVGELYITKEERDRFEGECCSVANAEDDQLQAVSDNINNYKVLCEQQLEAVAEQTAEFREENEHLILANKKLEEENSVLRNNNEKLDKEPSPKSKNSYLRTIKALSEALCGGLTGESNKDAGVVLTALASKGVEAPIGEKALSNYLKEANVP